MKYILAIDDDGYPSIWNPEFRGPLVKSNHGRWYREEDNCNISCDSYGRGGVSNYGIDLDDIPWGKTYNVEVIGTIMS